MVKGKQKKKKVIEKTEKKQELPVEFDFSDPKERLKNSKYGTSWMLVYGKLWLLIMAMLAAGMVITSCFRQRGYYDWMVADDVPLSHKCILTMAMVSLLAIVGLVWYLYVSFKKLTPGCFFWNKVFLMLYPIPYGMGKAMDLSIQDGGSVWFYTLMYALSAGLFSLFNFFYFERRKYLFDETLTAGEIKIGKPVGMDMAITLTIIALVSLICYVGFDSTLI